MCCALPNSGLKKNENIGWKRSLLPRTEEMNKRYKNPDNDSRGDWKPADFSVKTYSSDYDYEIETPSGRKVTPPKGRCWSTGKDKFLQLVKENRIWFGEEEKMGIMFPRLKNLGLSLKDR